MFADVERKVSLPYAEMIVLCQAALSELLTRPGECTEDKDDNDEWHDFHDLYSTEERLIDAVITPDRGL